MDLSKLPRLSETDKHVPPPVTPSSDGKEPAARSPEPLRAEPYVQPVNYGHAAGGEISGQVWLSAALGVIFMVMGASFARFAIAKLTGQTYHTGVDWTAGPKVGQEVGYYELQGYPGYTDTAIFLFGLAMVLEALMLIKAQRNTPGARAFVALALGLSALMTVFNVILAGVLFQYGVTPLMSLIAAAFGAYMTATEWKTLQHMRASI